MSGFISNIFNRHDHETNLRGKDHIRRKQIKKVKLKQNVKTISQNVIGLL